jgi:hypothetical protein
MLGSHKSAHDQKVEPDLHHASPSFPMSGLVLRRAIQWHGDSGNSGPLTDPMGIDRITESSGRAGGASPVLYE